jgi:diphthamide synthase subunit DPH2
VTLIDIFEKTSIVMKPQRELMKRLALVEKTKQAKTIGIIFTNVLPQVDVVLERIKSLIKSKKKEFILISLIQAVDNTKFGNFGEVDVFVLCTACNCGSFIMTTKAHVPLINLTELEIALGVRTTYGGLQWNEDQDEEEEDMEETENKDSTGSIKDEMKSLMEYKSNMRNHWFGLEVNAGETPVGNIKHGATGVASGYNNEPF